MRLIYKLIWAKGKKYIIRHLLNGNLNQTRWNIHHISIVIIRVYFLFFTFINHSLKRNKKILGGTENLLRTTWTSIGALEKNLFHDPASVQSFKQKTDWKPRIMWLIHFDFIINFCFQQGNYDTVMELKRVYNRWKLLSQYPSWNRVQSRPENWGKILKLLTMPLFSN